MIEGAAEPMIDLLGLGKEFSGRTAVENLDLRVRTGDIFGLLGHNGSGKSTSIGMMLGQVWPSRGKAILCGHNVIQSRRNALREVGAIFEAPAFYDYLSGWRNLQILSGYSSESQPERLKEVLDWVGLTGREKHAVKTYSHGMRTRLALAQALLPKPRLLILDEPSEGLDPEGIHEMRQTILRLRKELGLTILLSSHLLTEVEQLCSRIAVLHQGRKVFDGTVSEAKSSQSCLELRVDRFEDAVKKLYELALIASHSNNAVVLAGGIGSDRVVKQLVQDGFAVHEARMREKTLEDFYMELVQKQRQNSN